MELLVITVLLGIVVVVWIIHAYREEQKRQKQLKKIKEDVEKVNDLLDVCERMMDCYQELGLSREEAVAKLVEAMCLVNFRLQLFGLESFADLAMIEFDAKVCKSSAMGLMVGAQSLSQDLDRFEEKESLTKDVFERCRQVDIKARAFIEAPASTEKAEELS